jgi:hypothetical protein
VRKALSSGEAIVLHGDTAVELDLLIGASVVCGVEEQALLLPPLRSEVSLALSAVPQLPGPDDIVLPVDWATGQPDLFGQLAPLWSRQDIFKGLTLNGGCLWLRRRTAAIG